MNLTSLAALIESAYTNCGLNTPLKDVWPKAAKAVAEAIAGHLESEHVYVSSVRPGESAGRVIRRCIEPVTTIQKRDGEAEMF